MSVTHILSMTPPVLSRGTSCTAKETDHGNKPMTWDPRVVSHVIPSRSSQPQKMLEQPSKGKPESPTQKQFPECGANLRMQQMLKSKTSVWGQVPNKKNTKCVGNRSGPPYHHS